MYRKAGLILLMVSGMYAAVNAQCEKKLKLKAEKVYEVKADNTEGETIPITADITLSKDSILVALHWANGGISEIRGANSKYVCKMNKDYTEGTIDINSDAEITAHGKSSKSKMIFIVESKSGNLKVYGVPDNDKEKLCFVINDKKEIK